MKNQAARLVLWSIILIGIVAGCSDDPGKSAQSLPSHQHEHTSYQHAAASCHQHAAASCHQHTAASCHQHAGTRRHQHTNSTCNEHGRASCHQYTRATRQTRAQHPVHRRRRPLRREQIVTRRPYRKHPGGCRPDHHKQRQRIRLHHYHGRPGHYQRARRVRRDQRGSLADHRTTLRRRRAGARSDLRPCAAANRRRRRLSSHGGWRPEHRTHGRRGARAGIPPCGHHRHEPDRHSRHHLIHKNRERCPTASDRRGHKSGQQRRSAREQRRRGNRSQLVQNRADR